MRAKFVFIGAGGGALPLLEKSGISEAKGFGGVPVGGQWLVTTNPALINQHYAKVHGKASIVVELKRSQAVKALLNS
jgi:malate dehydrogenase (quinone)